MIKKIALFISLLILPIIFCLMIYLQISQIRKSKENFNFNSGIIEQFGITTKTHQGSYRSPESNSDVFFVKLIDNDTIYSYFSRIDGEYNLLKAKVKTGDFVKIYNEGYESKQNTVDIVELESKKETLIGKEKFNNKAVILIGVFITFLLLYFYLLYKFIYQKSKIKKKKHIR